MADTGKTLVALDYSQIELRILAHIADIQSLKQAFADGIDIHALTASQMFDVPLDQMTPGPTQGQGDQLWRDIRHLRLWFGA